MTDTGIERLGGAVAASPVVVSVPHAGRAYPRPLIDALRVARDVPVALEDRHVDAVARAALNGRTALIAHRARAWIDLNRGEDERDPEVDDGAPGGPVRSAKVRGGLGLVPRRAGTEAVLWRRRFADAEIAARIRDDHRPYHHALAQALAAARERFGIAVLLDLHSMPSLGPGRARVVVGDRFGRSAYPALVACVEGAAREAGHAVARNTPYAGGHILDRHAAPERGIHAIQLELDRSLYLDAALDRPGRGLAPTVALVAAVLAALEAAAGWGVAAAAE